MNGEKENIEHPTSNTEHRSVGYDARDDVTLRVEERVYDLEERLLEYAASVIRVVRDLPKDRESNHIAGNCFGQARRRCRTMAKQKPQSPQPTSSTS